MNRNVALAWTISIAVHAVAIMVLALCYDDLTPLDVAIDRGGVTITIALAPTIDHHGEWHIHGPHIEQDHRHDDAAAIHIHRHALEPLEPAPTPIDRTDADSLVQLHLPVIPAPRLTASTPPRRRAEVEPQVEETTQPSSSRPEPPERAKLLATVEPSPLVAASASETGATVDALPTKLPNNPAPPYPPDAFQRRQEGRVLLEVRVDERGDVASIRVSRSSGIDSLDRSALETVQRWKFLPARRGGRAVPFTVTVPIRFAIRSADSG